MEVSLAEPRGNLPAHLAPPMPPPIAGSADEEFLDRDLSWLEFNYRVLNEALDPRTPLLERVRFLIIFSSNLDEFFMKRMGLIRGQARPSAAARTAGVTVAPPHLLTRVRQQILELLWEQAECFAKTIRPALVEQGVFMLDWEQLDPHERQWAREFFLSNIYPILTPLAVDTGHPFPFISNLSTSLGIVLCPPDREERSFARVKVPEALPGWVRLPSPAGDGKSRFIRLRDIIQNNLHDLFPGMQILAVMQFRVTRGAPIEREDEEADDLRDLVEQELRQRRFADVVRLEHDANPDPWILQFLMQELKLGPEDVYRMPGELDYDDLRAVADLNLPALRHEPWQPAVPPYLENGVNIFKQICQGDLLVHHPYESFNASVERFITAAAEDPKVLVGSPGTELEFAL